MADLLNLYDIAQASGKQSVYVFNNRCTPVQHRRSTCRKCIEACPVEAITYHERKLTVDHVACVGCGACTTVCPTEAIISLEPNANALMGAALRSMRNNDGLAVVACERICARDAVKDEHFAQVPCLCRVHESMLADLVAFGAKRLMLVDGGCSNCKLRSCDKVTADVVASTEEMLSRVGSTVRVERVSEFPADFEREEAGTIGEQRRAAFEDARVSSKDVLGRAFKLFAKQETQSSKMSATVVQALGIDLDDPEPLAPRRQEKLVDALFKIGEANGALPDPFAAYDPKAEGEAEGTVGAESAAVMKSRFFGMLEFRDDRCNQCGICAVVCKHDALVRSKRKTPDGKNYFVEFTPSKCVQCALCQDACFRKALTVKDETPAAALFSFEPVLYR